MMVVPAAADAAGAGAGASAGASAGPTLERGREILYAAAARSLQFKCRLPLEFGGI